MTGTAGPAGRSPEEHSAHLASMVEFSCAHPTSLRRAQALVAMTEEAAGEVLLDRVVRAVVEVTGADGGCLHVLDRRTGELCLAADQGLRARSVDVVSRACGGGRPEWVAATTCRQTVSCDVRDDPEPRPVLTTGKAVRAVQVTPLTDFAGNLVGVVSAYFSWPHRPSEVQLGVMELFADHVGEQIARQLGSERGGHADPVGRVVLGALLRPPEAGPVPDEASGGSAQEHGLVVARTAINRLFALSLHAAVALGMATHPLVQEELRALIRDADDAIDEVRQGLRSDASHAVAQPAPATLQRVGDQVPAPRHAG